MQDISTSQLHWDQKHGRLGQAEQTGNMHMETVITKNQQTQISSIENYIDALP